jgi:hypothetical protein
MVGDERVRFCAACGENVYNFEGLSRKGAERLLREREGELCARLHVRADGTVVVEDCPGGADRIRERRAEPRVLMGRMVPPKMLAGRARGKR